MKVHCMLKPRLNRRISATIVLVSRSGNWVVCLGRAPLWSRWSSANDWSRKISRAYRRFDSTSDECLSYQRCSLEILWELGLMPCAQSDHILEFCNEN